MQVVECLVEADVSIIVLHVVEADASSNLQVVAGIPLVLQVETVLIEADGRGRHRCTVEAVGKGHAHGGCTVHEVFHAGIAVVTSTHNQITVFGLLVLKANTSHEFVLTEIVGEVIVDGEHLVAHAVAESIQLRTKRNIRTVILHDVDEGEVGGIGTTRVVHIRIGDEQLVGSLVTETAVQVGRERSHLVLHFIERIGECNTSSRGVGGSAIETRARRAGRSPLRIVGVVEAQCQTVVLIDVPVEAGQILIGQDVAGIGRRRASVVAILVEHEVGDGLQVGKRGTRGIGLRVAVTVLRGLPVGGNILRLHTLKAGKEEEFVLDDGATQRETVGLAACRVWLRVLLSVYAVAVHILVGIIEIRRTLEGIGTRLGDGIDATTDEVGLAHIEGSNHQLHLIKSLQRDRATTTRQVGRESEVVVQVSTVQCEVGRLAIATGKAVATTVVGRQLGNIANGVADGGQFLNSDVADVGGSTRLLGGELRSLSADHDFSKLVGVFGQPYIQVVRLGQL